MDSGGAGRTGPVEAAGRAVLTVPEFRRRYGISEATFWRMEQAGEAPPIYRIRSKKVIRVEDAEDWLAKCRVEPQSPAAKQDETASWGD